MSRAKFWGAVIALLPACQFVFGDFEQEDGPAATGGTSGTGGTTSSSGGSTGVTTGCPSNVGYFCSEGILVNCATQATQNCGNATLCRATATEGECLSCVANTYACQNNVRVQCKADQSGWATATDCRSLTDTPYCDSSVNDCVTCVRDDSMCKGTVLWTCSNLRSWVQEPCATDINAQGCLTVDATHAHCIKCDVDTFVPACSGSQLKTCNAGQLASSPCASGCVDAVGTTAAHCG